MMRFRTFLKQLRQYPSAIVGFVIIACLLGISAYTLVTIPYAEAIARWQGGEQAWADAPRNAAPIWTDWFTPRDLPNTIIRQSDPASDDVTKSTSTSDGITDMTIRLPFDYRADGFPKEIAVFLNAEFEAQRPFVRLTWHTPDGREIPLTQEGAGASQRINLSQSTELRERFGGIRPEIGLMSDPDASGDRAAVLKGRHELVITGVLFEENADLDAKLVLYGQVHGLAGTDHRRRDLMFGLMYGTPIALAFGGGTAIGATIFTFILAAIGAWYRGWVDIIIQRITEINLILPALVILIMVGVFYSRSLWVLMAVLIGLGIFSTGIKTYRALFLQVRESSYIEAAQSYGAGNWRVIWRYMLPRVVPTLIPQFVALIPTYIFLEASLAILGLGDPLLPTWGKILNNAQDNGALFQGQYYWILEPAVMLMITGVGFAMFGFALDRIFNPRLRVE